MSHIFNYREPRLRTLHVQRLAIVRPSGEPGTITVRAVRSTGTYHAEAAWPAARPRPADRYDRLLNRHSSVDQMSAGEATDTAPPHDAG